MHYAGMFGSFRELLALWTAKDLAAALGVKYPTAQSIKERGSVAPAHWDLLIAAASRKGFAIDAAMLARLARQRKAQQSHGIEHSSEASAAIAGATSEAA